jgi:hypothetical protein
MALSINAPIVPVRFVGGLPVTPLESRIEFPIGFGKQDYWVGKPLLPEQLAALPYKDRKELVLSAINGLGPAEEHPLPGNPEFASRVADWEAKTGTTNAYAVMYQTLAELAAPGEDVRRIVGAAQSGSLAIHNTPRDRWLSRLASWLYGERGPRIELA